MDLSFQLCACQFKISKFTGPRLIIESTETNFEIHIFGIHKIHTKSMLFYCRGEVHVDYDLFEERIHHHFTPPEDERYFLLFWAVPGSFPGPHAHDQPTRLLPWRILQVCQVTGNNSTLRSILRGKTIISSLVFF